MIRVLVVDDHPMFRAGLCSALEGYDDILVVGAAATGEEAVRIAAGTTPHVVLMDLRMPGYGGLEATRRILRDNPAVAVVVLTMADEKESVVEALRAGARGYLHKESDGADVYRAVLAASRGEAILGPQVAPLLAGYFGPAERPLPFPELTPAERKVLGLIAAGRTNPEIAQRLMLSPKTIRNRISMIFAKLHFRNRAEAIVRAREAGLGLDDEP